jgi:hypothetical protein
MESSGFCHFPGGAAGNINLVGVGVGDINTVEVVVPEDDDMAILVPTMGWKPLVRCYSSIFQDGLKE